MLCDYCKGIDGKLYPGCGNTPRIVESVPDKNGMIFLTWRCDAYKKKVK